MKKSAFVLIILFVVWILLRHDNAKSPDEKKESRAPVTKSDQHFAVEDAHTPRSSVQLTPPNNPATPSEISGTKEKPSQPEHESLTLETARWRAWKATGKAVNEVDKLKELSQSRAPPTADESKQFRGFVERDGHLKFIELRFDGDKWLLSIGDSPESLLPWPPRDVIPFLDRQDMWTLYYPKAEHLVLQHFSKINIPELNGDFEVLSGWLGNDLIGRAALVSYDQDWPSVTLIKQLLPERPRNE